MTSLKVGDLVELRAGTGTVGTVLDVVESHPRWLLVDWHTPPNTCINLCLPLIGPIGSRRLPQVFVMKPTDAWHCHHPALARWLHTPRLRRVLRQR
jgi:hypothetical protein